MKALPVLFTSFMRGLSSAAPAVAAELAYRLFALPGRPAPVLFPDRATAARMDHLVIDGQRVAVYRWGTGARKVLLVHGWGRRASELSAIIRTLQSTERTVIAFDAPGHGASPGPHASINKFAKTIRALDHVEGGFELIIAHSMGVLATFAALREGARARAIAAIAGPFSIEYILSVAVRVLHLTDPAAHRLREKIAHKFLQADIEQWKSSATSATDDMPLLVIHDQDDNDIEPGQADLITGAHNAESPSVMTKGLGHYSILADGDVLLHLHGFAADVDARSQHTLEPACEDEPSANVHTTQ